MTTLLLALLGLGMGIAAYAGGRGFSRSCATVNAASRLVVAGLAVIFGTCGLGGWVIDLSGFHAWSWLTALVGFLAILMGTCLLMLGLLMWIGEVADHVRQTRRQHRSDAISAEAGETE